MSELNNVHLRSDATPGSLLKLCVLSPFIYLRLICLVCSIIVFGCIASKGYIPLPDDVGGSICALDGSSACSFATAIGVITFLIALTFFIKDGALVLLDFSDALILLIGMPGPFSKLQKGQRKKYSWRLTLQSFIYHCLHLFIIMVKKILLIADIGVSGFCTFMWFVTFCFTANERRKTDEGDLGGNSVINCLNSVVAFSFLSIVFWGAILGVNVFFLIRTAKADTEYSRFSEQDPHGLPPEVHDPVEQYTAPED